MTAVFLKLRQCRDVLGYRCFAGEVAVVPVAVLVWILAMGFAPALSPFGSSPSVSLASPLQSLSQGDAQ